jgi:antitoxin MazE
MKTQIVRIGNAQGIRIPKPLLDQIGLEDEVEVQVEGDSLVIRPLKKARAGWAKAFREMARQNDDQLLDSETPSSTTWDEEEWEW